MAELRVPVSAADHVRGGAFGRVVLVEYGDYECPYCRLAHVEVLQLGRHFGDDLTYVFRHFPLTEIHPLAEPAAETAEFAGAQGRFWEMHDAIYAHQDELSLPLLLRATRALGLPERDVEVALEAKTYAPRVAQDFLSGVRSGVNGTPTFFINGRRHDGPFDYQHLAAAIQSVRSRP
ncbi:protein-disulfide isomerase [Methylorubrum rhodinum]|jgi:protein-disulfide isomerase|uniref:Protein-disulfide isomerase n=1 Tax=Methylorubrum rhodinum TaxID=29428 RepID=A0A840ZGM5_9HYPH|nr:thioredoxin domain-containing protein [Methylorubrum rhodinum]MBB5757152.1 protein-disulfide isomerase [Methylorubrum rhodinum]